MGKIKISRGTTKNPITDMGYYAGFCWSADTENEEKNFKRGLNCLKSNHGRVLEFPQIYLEIEGYSAKVIRELYTHIGGSPTRLQESTRYVNYSDFSYIMPKSLYKDKDAETIYKKTMKIIREAVTDLLDLGIPNEDATMLLPIGMETTMVMRTNLRQVIDMSHQRMCSRAYWEFRQLMNDLCNELSNYSEEWKFIVENFFMPKCEVYGYCTEEKGCGRKPKKDN